MSDLERQHLWINYLKEHEIMNAVAEDIRVEEEVVPFIILPNMSGDVVITWDKDNEAHVKALVQAKMDEGYSFFILKPRKLFGREIPMMAKTKVKSLSDLADVNTVRMKTNEENDRGLAKEFQLPPTEGNRTVGVKQNGLGIEYDVKDDAVNLSLKEGKVRISERPRGPNDGVRRARTAEEVVKNQSAGIKPIAGG